MERKWIGPKDYWIKYKEENGIFWLVESVSVVSWQVSHLSNWDEIEQHMKMNGYVEDCAHYAGGNIVFVPGSSLLKCRGLTSVTALLALHDLEALKTNRSLYPFLGAIKINDGCPHEWATYVGFMKTETYCTNCNEVQK